jgi:hypothetical protein
MAMIWSPTWIPAFAAGAPSWTSPDQDLFVLGALDRDADAAAAVALEPVVPGFVGIGIAAVAVELLGCGGHRLADQQLPVDLLQGGGRVDGSGHQLGQGIPPGATIRRVGRSGAGQDFLAVAFHLEGAVAGLEDECGIAAGEAAIGLDRQIAEVGFIQVAVADGPVGLEDDALDADIARGRAAAVGLTARRIGSGRAGHDQTSGSERCGHSRQRRTKEREVRHVHLEPLR